MRFICPRAEVLETAQGLEVDLPIILAPCPASLRVRPRIEKHAVSVAPQLGDRVQIEADDFINIFLLRIVLRHEVARLIVWQAVLTKPVVPSAVSYVVRQQGNALSNAHGQSTHSHPTDARTARERRICQHQVEMGLDGWYGEHR